jgi:hypothetical protein
MIVPIPQLDAAGTKVEFGKVAQPVASLHKERHAVPNSSLCAEQALVYRASLVRAILREIRNLFWRIREIRRTQLHRRGISINPLRQTPSPPERRENALACCIQDTRSLCTSRPVTTLIEAQLFVQGWELGADWLNRNCGTAPRA